MICVPYYVDKSRIPNAGKGVFLKEFVPAGRIMTAPTEIPHTVAVRDLLDSSKHYHLESSVRWFEDQCTVSPDWPDECYVNHAFAATGLWHLGFIFALRDLPAHTEITVDYRHLLPPDVEENFCDATTGERIVGFSWEDSLRISTGQLSNLLANFKYGFITK